MFDRLNKLKLRVWGRLPVSADLEELRERNARRVDERKKEMQQAHVLHPGNDMRLINLRNAK